VERPSELFVGRRTFDPERAKFPQDGKARAGIGIFLIQFGGSLFNAADRRNNRKVRLMFVYRVYCLDGVNRFQRTETIKAATDEDAIRRACGMMEDCTICEVWERERLVSRMNARESDQ